MILIWPLLMLEAIKLDETRYHPVKCPPPIVRENCVNFPKQKGERVYWVFKHTVTKIEDDIPLRFVLWTTVSQVWTFLAAAYIVIVPLFEEVNYQ